jgi:hypothetical protein
VVDVFVTAQLGHAAAELPGALVSQTHREFFAEGETREKNKGKKEKNTAEHRASNYTTWVTTLH